MTGSRRGWRNQRWCSLAPPRIELGAFTDTVLARPLRLVMVGLKQPLGQRLGRQTLDQHPQPTSSHPRATPPEVAQVDPTKSKIGLHRVTVFTDQPEEAGDSPASPKPIASAISSDN